MLQDFSLWKAFIGLLMCWQGFNIFRTSASMQTSIVKRASAWNTWWTLRIGKKNRLALLAGCHNLGGTVGSHFGAMLLHYWNVKPRGHGVIRCFVSLFGNVRSGKPVQLPLPQALAHRLYMLCEWLYFRIGQEGDAAQFDNLWIVASQSIMISEKTSALWCVSQMNLYAKGPDESFIMTLFMALQFVFGRFGVKRLSQYSMTCLIFFFWPFYVVSLSHRGGTVCLLKLIAVRGHDKWNREFRQRSHQFCHCSQQWSFGTCCPTASWPSWAWFFCGTETAIANLNS